MPVSLLLLGCTLCLLELAHRAAPAWHRAEGTHGPREGLVPFAFVIFHFRRKSGYIKKTPTFFTALHQYIPGGENTHTEVFLHFACPRASTQCFQNAHPWPIPRALGLVLWGLFPFLLLFSINFTVGLWLG